MTGEGKDNAIYLSRPQSPCLVVGIEGCVVWPRLGLFALGDWVIMCRESSRGLENELF